VVMNNAGAGMFGPVEVCSIDDFRKMMEVNYFGPIAVTKAALPLLRQSRGTLINVSSMAGIITMDGTAPYAASKHAILGATTALREELAPLGVRVVCVLPGGFRSAFWSDPSNTIRSGGETVYDSQPAGHIFEQTRSHVGNEMGDPAKFGKLMIDIAGHSNPPAHLMVGADALDFVEMKRADLSRQLQDNADLSRTTDFAT